MPIYCCKIKDSDEVIWKISASSIKNAKIKFAQIKHLDIDEYNRLFDTEEEIRNDRP